MGLEDIISECDIRDLSLTAREELDLLVKWLRPESSQQAKRIRSVHVHNAALGVQMA